MLIWSFSATPSENSWELLLIDFRSLSLVDKSIISLDSLRGFCFLSGFHRDARRARPLLLGHRHHGVARREKLRKNVGEDGSPSETPRREMITKQFRIVPRKQSRALKTFQCFTLSILVRNLSEFENFNRQYDMAWFKVIKSFKRTRQAFCSVCFPYTDNQLYQVWQPKTFKFLNSVLFSLQRQTTWRDYKLNRLVRVLK